MTLSWDKVEFICDSKGPKKNIPIMQRPIQQMRESCSYASISGHIDYNIRLVYAKLGIAIPPERLIDHETWQKNATVAAGKKVNNVWLLLTDAKQNGVPLWNDLSFHIDERHNITDLDDVKTIRAAINSMTLIMVFEVRDDYRSVGRGGPYMGRGDLVKNKTTGNIEHHAVVVVGEYKDDGLFAPGEAVEPLWIYQDSNIRGEGDLGKGLNVVRHRLVKEVYFAKIYATNVLLDKVTGKKAKRYRKPNKRIEPEILR